MANQFPVTRTQTPKPKPDQSNLGFGKYFTDHMLIMDYDAGQGWHDGRIVPYGPISLDPASCVLHYAQMMFEGMKAYHQLQTAFEHGMNMVFSTAPTSACASRPWTRRSSWTR